EADLRRALTNHELLILYQAQVDMRTGRVAGMECAIRWDHPQRGRLHAVPFVDDVPPLGLASEYMRFIAHTTTRQFAVWRAAGVEIPRFAINAWPSSIAAELRDDILRCCEAAQLEPSCVE